MKNRKIIIQFETPAGMKELDGIEVKFSVEKLASAVMNKANIDICNLAADDIEYLTTYTSQFIAIAQHKRIRIFAGYVDTGVSLIFDGDIVEALPTNGPDRWLKCKALSGYYNARTPVSTVVQGTNSIRDVCAAVAGFCNLSLNYMATSTKTISDFEYTGGKTRAIKELNELGDIVAYEDDGVLVVQDKGEPRTDVGIRRIDETSGLIGIPKPDAIGVECQILLDNSIKIGQKIYLESKIIPSACGEYYIYELKHSGDLRGNEFYTEIKARRIRSVKSAG